MNDNYVGVVIRSGDQQGARRNQRCAGLYTSIRHLRLFTIRIYEGVEDLRRSTQTEAVVLTLQECINEKPYDFLMTQTTLVGT